MKACKDKQSTLNGQTFASLVDPKNEVYETYKIPTFRPQGIDREIDLDVKTLTKSNGATALCVTDPFAYYSCFTPSGSLSSKVANLATADDKQDEDGSGQTAIISVTRKTRVSTECHLVHSLQETSSVQVDDEDDSECDDFSHALCSMLGMNLEDDSQDGGIDSILNELFQEQ